MLRRLYHRFRPHGYTRFCRCRRFILGFQFVVGTAYGALSSVKLFHTYKDGKFEFTEEEFIRYFDNLKINNKTVNVHDFIHDLCANLCLMFQEGVKYHFSHRSFQEYFCAMFFSKQKEIVITKLGGFFTKLRRRTRSDHTFNMLYDMIPDKIETLVLIPYLQNLFDRCDGENGYWTFLEEMYQRIRYEKGETNDCTVNYPQQYLFSFVLGLIDINYEYDCDNLPDDDSLIEEEYGYTTVPMAPYKNYAMYGLIEIDTIDTII